VPVSLCCRGDAIKGTKRGYKGYLKNYLWCRDFHWKCKHSVRGILPRFCVWVSGRHLE